GAAEQAPIPAIPGPDPDGPGHLDPVAATLVPGGGEPPSVATAPERAVGQGQRGGPGRGAHQLQPPRRPPQPRPAPSPSVAPGGPARFPGAGALIRSWAGLGGLTRAGSAAPVLPPGEGPGPAGRSCFGASVSALARGTA